MAYTSDKFKMRNAIKKNIVLLMFIFSIFTILFVTIYSRETLKIYMFSEEHYIVERLKAVSISAASFVDADKLDTFRTIDDMNLPEYQNMRKKLHDFSLYEENFDRLARFLLSLSLSLSLRLTAIFI
jgi:hypothetical protein